MTKQRSVRNEKMTSPAGTYDKPHDIAKDEALSHEEKRDMLNTWEQDARQLMTASNEGMPGPEEGLESHDHHRLGEVVRAKDNIGEKPNHKPSH
jgi:hypothetical protein